MKKQLEDVVKRMDVDRTDELFDSAIRRTEFNKKEPMNGDDDIKKARTLVAVGNLHINTGKTKLGAIRLLGYVDNTRKLTMAVKRKTRSTLRKRMSK